MNIILNVENGATVSVSEIHHVETVNVGCPAQENRPLWKAGGQRELMEQVIGGLIAENLFKEKQDFAALHRIIIERSLDSFTLKGFAAYLCENFNVSEALRPTENNLKRVIFGKKAFPNWELPYIKDAARRARLVHIATLFLEGMGLPLEP